MRQTQSELTGEHTVVMVRGLQSSKDEELGWLGEFSKGELLSCSPVFGNHSMLYRLSKTISLTSIIQVQGV